MKNILFSFRMLITMAAIASCIFMMWTIKLIYIIYIQTIVYIFVFTITMLLQYYYNFSTAEPTGLLHVLVNPSNLQGISKYIRYLINTDILSLFQIDKNQQNVWTHNVWNVLISREIFQNIDNIVIIPHLRISNRCNRRWFCRCWLIIKS